MCPVKPSSPHAHLAVSLRTPWTSIIKIQATFPLKHTLPGAYNHVIKLYLKPKEARPVFSPPCELITVSRNAFSCFEQCLATSHCGVCWLGLVRPLQAPPSLQDLIFAASDVNAHIFGWWTILIIPVLRGFQHMTFSANIGTVVDKLEQLVILDIIQKSWGEKCIFKSFNFAWIPQIAPVWTLNMKVFQLQAPFRSRLSSPDHCGFL